MTSLNNMESDMDYLKSMSEDEKVAFLKTLVRLAGVDGAFDDDEIDFIKEVAAVFEVPSKRVDEVKKLSSEEEVLSAVKVIKNRRAALELIKEMCLLANADSDLSDNELMLIGKVGEAMGVELEKIQQISRWVIDRIIWLEQGKIIFEKF